MQVIRRQSSLQPPHHKGSTHTCCQTFEIQKWRCKEATLLLSRNCCPMWDPKISEKYWPIDQEGTISASCPWDLYAYAGRLEHIALPEHIHALSPGGCRGLTYWAVWRYKSLCHARETRDNFTKGYDACPTHSRWIWKKSIVVVWVDRISSRASIQKLVTIMPKCIQLSGQIWGGTREL